MKKIERSKEQAEHVKERFNALNAALENMEAADQEQYEAATELGFQISFTCPQVLAEFFTAKAAENSQLGHAAIELVPDDKLN